MKHYFINFVKFRDSDSMNIADIRKQFPVLKRQVYGKPLVYFDNAATAQRLKSGVDLQAELSLKYNANIHRAVHNLAIEATEKYEEARDETKAFINAEYREEIIFTSGTTASINLVAHSFGEAFINEGDEIILSEAEHHSNIVPWQLLCDRKKAVIKILPVDDFGCVNLLEFSELISEKTRLVAITHISNVLGIINPVKDVIAIAHKKNIPVLIDGAQGIVHQRVDVQELDSDFYAFSGHKIYAATGTGVLYGKKKWLEKMPPFMGGGEMIETVRFSGTTFAPLPEKFEAGTMNINSIPTLKCAYEFIKSLNDNELKSENEAVKEYLYDALRKDSRIRLYGVPHRTIEKIPLFSFTVDGVHHEDLALILDKFGIALRSGQMCAEPLMDRFGVTGMLRVSIAPYNTMQEAEYFIKSLDKAIKMLS